MRTISTTDFQFPGQTAVYRGKVRDVYTIEDKYIVSVATDRISAFDVILPRAIPHKGQVLNQIAEYFLNATADIVPNWLLGVPDPQVSMGHLCQPFKIEMIVRGMLAGSAWRAYKAGARDLCGNALPDGMQEYDGFPEPLVTPTTKADAGHDLDIGREEIVAQGLATTEQFDELSDLAKKLFARGQEMAQAKGLVLADTKYEFGLLDGKVYVIDEIHTPDSSRYFYAKSYSEFMADRSRPEPKHLSKEFVREWLMDNNFSGQADETVPDMTDEFVASVSERYIELFEQLTGHKFAPAEQAGDVLKRIETNVLAALKELK